ncbi:MAG: AraC family transcriptional regulator ligand-binding domain-containing protein, partial [Terriglobales bacterium]
MISVEALAGVSALVRHAFGDKVLRQANQAVMLDIELIEDQACFIPHSTMTRFVAEIERRSGEPHLGLLVAPHLSVAQYGRWGEYVLAADTLGAALARAVSALGYHASGDRMEVSVDSGIGRASYFNAARGNPGYASVASGTAGVLLSLFRSYLPPDWHPKRLELDIPRPRAASLFEDAFGCPV